MGYNNEMTCLDDKYFFGLPHNSRMLDGRVVSQQSLGEYAFRLNKGEFDEYNTFSNVGVLELKDDKRNNKKPQTEDKTKEDLKKPFTETVTNQSQTSKTKQEPAKTKNKKAVIFMQDKNKYEKVTDSEISQIRSFTDGLGSHTDISFPFWHNSNIGEFYLVQKDDQKEVNNQSNAGNNAPPDNSNQHAETQADAASFEEVKNNIKQQFTFIREKYVRPEKEQPSIPQNDQKAEEKTVDVSKNDKKEEPASVNHKAEVKPSMIDKKTESNNNTQKISTESNQKNSEEKMENKPTPKSDALKDSRNDPKSQQNRAQSNDKRGPVTWEKKQDQTKSQINNAEDKAENVASQNSYKSDPKKKEEAVTDYQGKSKQKYKSDTSSESYDDEPTKNKSNQSNRPAFDKTKSNSKYQGDAKKPYKKADASWDKNSDKRK